MLHMFLSYCKSHIYDIHSLLVGTIIFFLIYVWKGSIDKMIEGWVNKRYSDRTEDRQRAVTRRAWGLIYILVILLAFLLFTAASVISPLVHNSVPASIVSASFAITEMEFYKTFIKKKGD
ncbi:MAG: hypothetical protein J6Y12_08505 [Lachnospiraceae bacterium]|nr:hypothetical protein [Lachnospiraceae bacterium]